MSDYQIILIVAALASFLVTPCAVVGQVDFVRDVRPIFLKHCCECHGEAKQKSGLRLDAKTAAFKGGDNYGIDIVAGKAKESPLIDLVTATDESEVMPPKGKPRLSALEIETLTRWINEGAAWPEGVDLVKLTDKSDHWSFKPLSVTLRSAKEAASLGGEIIDDFIDAKLAEKSLQRAPPTDPVSLIRRLSFDLTGLPPTPEQVAAFVAECRSGSSIKIRNEVVETLVNDFLSSPRYGERWAQHWLDVVRYADTHGFEVNTERPHAWPYRDYVIRALNNDTPYDRFIQEQIVGDALGEDAATGFLVTASVLLPGQIGQDEPSQRLARQDALDEIVNNVGQTFLGLSIGCARCHDHKFDPITSEDYYAMQAFVAGVEYSDRPLRTPEAEAQKKAALALRQRVAEIDERLAEFAPRAHPGTQSRATNAKENIETFAPRAVKFVRFTIHDANRHPSLGLIEPCIDEFEIFTDESPSRNVALASHGTKVTASGSRESNIHKLEHINDGRPGNSRSWMADAKGRGWVMFELPEPTRIAKVVWSRDREGTYNDRLATSYTLEAGVTADKLVALTEVLPPRPSVNPRQNIDRFQPIPAKRLRFTILSTNSLEPCVDELEVFNTAGKNIALASLGTLVTTSGDSFAANRHEPRFVNDGAYGNSRSWMSHEPGQGWVTLEFPAEEQIHSVVWGRDREGKFADRLATTYRIESNRGDEWQLLADSTDRHPWMAETDRVTEFTTVGLTVEESQEANRLLEEKRTLEPKITATENGQLAFAGTFRQPDVIRLLSRGDPEQPKEEVLPEMLSVFRHSEKERSAALRTTILTKNSAEQDRRKALAEWIASPQNPLTARVMVNRIWQGHFGTGLVETPSDFGRMGLKPTHPELLDWLADEFIRSGWSIKHMQRLIVLSATYRQRSDMAGQSDALMKDADARWLWRYPSRRLDAETIRDSILAMNGRLNLKMSGRGFDLFDKRGGLSGFNPVESFNDDGLRRMVYAHKVRREREAVFGAFDCPDAGQSTARRRESTTPIQALNLFNSRFTLEQSQALADRVKQDVGEDYSKQIQRIYQLTLSRDPSIEELRDVEPIIRDQGLATLGRALFNANEALFLP